jgi:hypothetical protein
VEIAMRLTFNQFDGRGRNFREVIDQDTGKKVGHIQSNGVGFENYGGIDISLFDGKYKITVSSFKECCGFVSGVQAVLRHMTSATEYTAKTRQSTAA